ncbi:MAG: hypothetical protein ACI95C_002342 [Pseudohongiellaceae bacterium]|jgi:hypothetical protein
MDKKKYRKAEVVLTLDSQSKSRLLSHKTAAQRKCLGVKIRGAEQEILV